MRRVVAAAVTAAILTSVIAAASPASAATPPWEAPTPLSEPEGGGWGHQLIVHGTALIAGWDGFGDGASYVGVSRSTDDGKTWSDTIRIAGDGAPVGGLRIVSHGSTVVAAWKQYSIDAGRWEVVSGASTDGGRSWSQTPSVLTVQETGSPISGLALTTDGVTLTASWRTLASGPGGYTTEFWSTASSDGGATWSTPTLITAHPSAFGFALVASGAVRVATWEVVEEVEGVERYSVFTARSTDGGASWSPPSAVSAPDADTSFPRIAFLGSTVVIAWTTGGRLESTRSTDSGSTWSTPVTIHDSQGGWVTLGDLWTDGTTLLVGYTPYVGGESEGLRIARSTDGGASWTSSAIVAAGDAVGSVFATTGSIITVAWVQHLAVGTESSLGRDAVSVSRSTDGGRTWSAPTAVSDSDRQVEAPALASTAAHTAVVWGAYVDIQGGTVILVSADTDLPELAATGAVDPLPIGALAALLLAAGASAVGVQRRRARPVRG